MKSIGVWLRALLGSKEEPDSGPSTPQASPPDDGPESFAEGNNDFAVTMHGDGGIL